jgi:hypothetical protein
MKLSDSSTAFQAIAAGESTGDSNSQCVDLEQVSLTGCLCMCVCMSVWLRVFC